jgi:tetratricopeptide (TPR) repeat protein
MATGVRHRPVTALVLGAFGGLLLLLALPLHWFDYPVSGPPAPQLPFAVVGREAPATILFKLVCFAAIAGGALWARRTAAPDAPRRIAARLSAALFCVLLFYPHAVMVWCPATSARAQWLEAQHAQLTQHTGDDFTLSEVKRYGWKSRVYPVDVLNQVGTMNVPALSPMAVPFGGLSQLFDWFGYSDAFCEFASKGWGLALLGSFLVFLASCRTGNRLDHAELRNGAVIGSVVVGGGAAIALGVAAVAGFELDRARSAVEEGRPVVGLARLDTATRLLPLLREDSQVALERGILEARLGRSTPEVRFYRAKVLQSEGLLDEAEQTFGSLLASEPDGPIRRESERAVLRRGIRKLNAGEVESAIQSLEAVLGADAASPKANYVLQLAYLHASRFDSLRALARTMRRTYLFFSSDLRLPIMATAQENVAYASYLEKDAMGAHTIWATLSDPKYLAASWW